MRYLVRRSPKFFLFATLAAVALRLFFIFRLPSITNDSFIYGDIAKNWLQHGTYGLTGASQVAVPTCIRLPGYPAFLALVFEIFGMEHYRAAIWMQMFADIGTCLLIGDLARRMISEKAAEVAFFLAAVCPFLANYAAAALTETLEIFFTTLALDLAAIALVSDDGKSSRKWVGCGLAIAAAILLRPDGGLLLIAVTCFLFLVGMRRALIGDLYRSLLIGAAIVLAASLAPLVPWTLRNLHTLHRLQPLAPRYANEDGEFVPLGFNRWVKTWMADYASVEEVYWNVPGDIIDAHKLPSRAFDSEEQRATTQQLLDEYNATSVLTPVLDARFATLAAERAHAHPLRSYVWLPVLRVVDMWMRPRTELLPSDPRWWEFNDDPKWSATAVFLGAINFIYIAAALAGVLRQRPTYGIALLLMFVAFRSMFLGSLENPETRYTLEMYPVVIFFCSVLLSTKPDPMKSRNM